MKNFNSSVSHLDHLQTSPLGSSVNQDKNFQGPQCAQLVKSSFGMYDRGAQSRVQFLLLIECLGLPRPACASPVSTPRFWVHMEGLKRLAMEGSLVIEYTKHSDYVPHFWRLDRLYKLLYLNMSLRPLKLQNALLKKPDPNQRNT